MNHQMEFLSILQDLVSYRGRCPKMKEIKKVKEIRKVKEMRRINGKRGAVGKTGGVKGRDENRKTRRIGRR